MGKVIHLHEYYISEAFIGGYKTFKRDVKKPAYRKNDPISFDISDAFFEVYKH
ncbi:hypothetical protein [Metabacillus fastidiosus]|uniref:Uncharacterized protein n=1 Tax=Metabacillus fastidiosus TaxID=1458 RepID=A0ABU6NWF6_9BACI|nr:hypothetical protein [Metabacillus fastidiosus]MEC2076897.1 hypothetical protein [Metabacillus fastidiosus]MED4401449.1 hypothetical protein [Metabacillus fastidiosus]MED4452982.1 hypothetical protein [Metabacillus fastidiosus]MED4463083.1 hypothetical protein [Metabacillus fastidiosus]MED4532433.1 hypothetical protein [Metabacillus fastidiosus]